MFMKKLMLSIVLFCVFFLTALSSYSKPIYLTLRIGFFAKWEITIGECEDGNGVCMALGNPSNPDNAALGFDDAVPNFLFIKIESSSEVSKPFASGKFELKEDSPVNPEIIKSLNKMKVPINKYVILKSGIYTVTKEGNFFVVKVPYYIK
jgi:hypothetical protein